jgi:hypothetical protein
LAALALLAGCGGGGGTTTTVRPAIIPINPNLKNVPGHDPDAEQRAGTEVHATIRAAGNGHYQVLVQNTSQIGFINSFDWIPPAGMTVTSVSSSTGHCELERKVIACQATLRPPKCTCRPGGRMTIDFTADVEGTAGKVEYGFFNASVVVRTMTPVPYIIPSYLGANPQYADLPSCKKGQENTTAAPCVHSGQESGK